jgi:hypothetical protein
MFNLITSSFLIPLFCEWTFIMNLLFISSVWPCVVRKHIIRPMLSLYVVGNARSSAGCVTWFLCGSWRTVLASGELWPAVCIKPQHGARADVRVRSLHLETPLESQLKELLRVFPFTPISFPRTILCSTTYIHISLVLCHLACVCLLGDSCFFHAWVMEILRFLTFATDKCILSCQWNLAVHTFFPFPWAKRNVFRSAYVQ